MLHSASDKSTSRVWPINIQLLTKPQFNICHIKMKLLTYPHELLTNPLKILKNPHKANEILQWSFYQNFNHSFTHSHEASEKSILTNEANNILNASFNQFKLLDNFICSFLQIYMQRMLLHNKQYTI